MTVGSDRGMRGVVALLGCTLACGSPPAPEAPPAPPITAPPPVVAPPAAAAQLTFGAVGAAPADWTIAADRPGTLAVVDGETAPSLQLTPTAGPARAAHALDVARYRGQRLRITARGQLGGGGLFATGALGLDLERPGGGDGPADRPRSRGITQPTWDEATVIADVPADATAAAVVVSAMGGPLTVGPITVESLGAVGAGDQAPRPLAGRALDNVVAFARLYGAVRYFHPSDEAAALTAGAWERFVRDGAARVEGAADPAALAAALTELFAPLTAGLEVHPDATPPPAAPALAVPAGARPVRWDHHGLGVSPRSIYHSERLGLEATPQVITIVTAAPVETLRGARVRVTARVRTTRWAAGADAGIWMSGPSTTAPPLYSEPEVQPDPTAAWTPIVVEGVVPADAPTLVFGVQVFGDVAVAFDGLVVERLDGARPAPVALPTWAGGATVAPTWNVGQTAGGFVATPGGDGCDGRRTCLAIARVAQTGESPWVATLGGGVSARVPVTLWHDETRTQPVAGGAAAAPTTTPLVATDRATRLAAVIIAWNILQHFYPYFDVVGGDWPAELRTALGRAAVDADATAFLATLRRMIGGLRDGHGFVAFASGAATAVAPWTWTAAEGALVIERVAPACACDLAPGDVVVSIDGVATADAIAALAPTHTYATAQHAALQIRNRLRQGAPGERRALVVRRGGVEHRVEVALVDGKAVTADLAEPRPKNGAEVAPGIRYVDAGNCPAAEWAALLPELATARALLIDMRGYPNDFAARLLGHFTDTPLVSPQWHIPHVTRPDRVGLTFDQSNWPVPVATPRLARAVFLTDGRAVSAAETFMGIVEGHRLGEIVGAPTAGTNGNINPFDLPGGYGVWWTGMKVLKVDGSRHHGVGIQPTVPAAPTIAGLAAGRDEVLERAIAVAQQPPRKRPRPRRAR